MTDATYAIVGRSLMLNVVSPRGAKWIAKYSTTNICGTICYSVERGQQIIQQIKEDGLVLKEKK